MYFKVNLKMKKPTLCYCFTWIAFIELNNFTVAYLLIRKTWDGRFAGNIVYTPLSVRGTERGEEVTGKEGMTFFRGFPVFT